MRFLKLTTIILVVSGWTFNVSYGGINDFQPVASVPAGVSPRGIAVGNVFGNGSKSLVVANFGSSTFMGQTTPATVLESPKFHRSSIFPVPQRVKVKRHHFNGRQPKGRLSF